jgi:transcriptional regulator with XRE-family HTH domain
LRPLEGVKELRERRMLSQQELAHRAGVSLFTVQRIERGGGSVRPKTGRAIAAALGVGVEDLLPKAPAPSPEPSLLNGLEDERRAEWDTAVRNARQLRERGQGRIKELLASWRESKERVEPLDARRGYLGKMAELLQDAYDAETALFRMLGDPLDLATVDLDEFAELQAASRFYGELRGLVEGAGLHIRTDRAQQQEEEQEVQPETHLVEEEPEAA